MATKLTIMRYTARTRHKSSATFAWYIFVFSRAHCACRRPTKKQIASPSVIGLPSQRDTAHPHDWPKHILIYSSLTDPIPVRPSTTFPPPTQRPRATRDVRRGVPQATRDHPSARPPGRAARGRRCAGSAGRRISARAAARTNGTPARSRRPPSAPSSSAAPQARLEAGDTTVTALLAAPALSDSGSSVPPHGSRMYGELRTRESASVGKPWNRGPSAVSRGARGSWGRLPLTTTLVARFAARSAALLRGHMFMRGTPSSCFSLCTRYTSCGRRTGHIAGVFNLCATGQALLDGLLHARFATREWAVRSAGSSRSVYRRTSGRHRK